MANDRRRDERRGRIDRRSDDRRDAFAPGRRVDDALYGQSESPCRGICALSDTKTCEGGACSRCDAAHAGLCARREVLSAARAQKAALAQGAASGVGIGVGAGIGVGIGIGVGRPVFGADSYAIAAEAFLTRLDEDADYDGLFCARMLREQRAISKYALEVEAQIGASPLPTPAMSEVLVRFSTQNPSPTLFATQIFLYVFRNHRCGIEVDHALDRFAVCAQTMNGATRKLFGASYASLLSVVRTEHAKRYLAIEGIRINEAGNLAGFDSANNFSVTFKRLTGMSPKDYRAAKFD